MPSAIEIVYGTSLNCAANAASQAVTATSDGLTTGLISADTSIAVVTSANSAHKISLPAGTIGMRIRLIIGSTACKLIAVTALDQANGVVIGSTNTLTLAANASYICEYLATNDWRVRGTAQAGSRIVPTGTAALTTITHTAPGTPDYAIQNLTQTTPFGFVTADEGNSVLKVIANLQARVTELEGGASPPSITPA